MKIAYINQSYPPMISGAAIVVQKLAEGMATRGHSSLVITASDSGKAYTQILGNNKIIRLNSIPNPKRANQNFVPLSFHQIYKEIKDFHPDIIHTHDVLFMGMVGIYASRKLDIPIIATIHQLPWFLCAYLPSVPGLNPFIEHSLWFYSQWLNKQCEIMIVPTSTIAQVIKRQGGYKTQVISNGVDLNHFNPKTPNPDEEKSIRLKYKIENKCPIILHVGRLDVDKNVDIAIKAAAIAIHKTDAILLVVGDGERRNNLIKLANELGIQNRCKFLGFVDPNTDLSGLYRMSSVFITASEIETQGLVILEAMASGLPIVAVEATCIPEVVKHELNGYLAPPRNVLVLADYLVKILKNPSNGHQMGEISRMKVLHHSINHSLDKYEIIYKMIFQGIPPVKTTRP